MLSSSGGSLTRATSPSLRPQGVEVTVNASSLDDIDPSAIAQRLLNGTAVVASPVLTRLRTREEEHPDVVRKTHFKKPAGISSFPLKDDGKTLNVSE